MVTSTNISLDLNAVQLRPMHEEDIPRVCELEALAYQFPWSAKIITDCIRAGYSCWAAEYLCKVEGYGVLTMAAGESHILNVCVNPALHQQGLGKHIVAHLLNVARDHHAETAFLEVRPSNLAAYNLYAKMGFNEVGKRKDYYPTKGATREDALIMALNLS